jgi:hypothetical protein
MLAFWTAKNAERMERVFTSSALEQRGEWHYGVRIGVIYQGPRLPAV